jgi:hypothetical protein
MDFTQPPLPKMIGTPKWAENYPPSVKLTHISGYSTNLCKHHMFLTTRIRVAPHFLSAEACFAQRNIYHVIVYPTKSSQQIWKMIEIVWTCEEEPNMLIARGLVAQGPAVEEKCGMWRRRKFVRYQHISEIWIDKRDEEQWSLKWGWLQYRLSGGRPWDEILLSEACGKY